MITLSLEEKRNYIRAGIKVSELLAIESGDDESLSELQKMLSAINFVEEEEIDEAFTNAIRSSLAELTEFVESPEKVGIVADLMQE